MAKNNENKTKSVMDAKSVAVKAMTFAEIPLPIQRGKGGRLGSEVYTVYGSNNLYPNYLLRLYNESAIHKAIVDSKVNYILGDGLRFKDSDKEVEFKINERDDAEDLMRKALKDFVIFNYFTLEVVYKSDGTIHEINHVPAHKIRANNTHTKYWYSEDWASPRQDTIEFDSYSKDIGGDLESKIYFYAGYTPSVGNTYPTPEYSGAIKSIEIDIAIKDFHLNNINNTFSGNTIISFFRGEPTPEIKDDIVNVITGSYSGTKGDKIIFQFLDKDEQEPTITSLNPTDWNEAYLSLKEDTTEDIVIGHSVTSPMLMGIKTEGQLGGNTELETAYQIFKNLWVKVKRREFLSAFNDLVEDQYGEIDIIDKTKLFPTELSDSLKEKVMTIDEIREIEGLSPLADGSGNRLIGAPVVVQEESIQSAESLGLSAVPNITEEQWQQFEAIGMDKSDAVIVESSKFSSDKDKHFKSNFADDSLTNYLIKNKLTGKTFRDIQVEVSKESGDRFTIESIKEEYGRLVALRVIPNTKLLTEETIAQIKRQYPDGDNASDDTPLNRIEVRYSYEGPADDKNRAFCHRLVRANKLYTMEDIQRISALFGYDVRNYSGGFNCRHRWAINSVVRRNS